MFFYYRLHYIILLVYTIYLLTKQSIASLSNDNVHDNDHDYFPQRFRKLHLAQVKQKPIYITIIQFSFYDIHKRRFSANFCRKNVTKSMQKMIIEDGMVQPMLERFKSNQVLISCQKYGLRDTIWLIPYIR